MQGCHSATAVVDTARTCVTDERPGGGSDPSRAVGIAGRLANAIDASLVDHKRVEPPNDAALAFMEMFLHVL